MRQPSVTLVVTLAAFVLATATAPAATQSLPAEPARLSDAEGTRLITTLCGSCHARGSAVGTHRSKQDWAEVLEWMIDEGAVMSDDEFEEVLGFLSVRYGRVAINTAPADEVRHVLELTVAQVDRLVAARNAGRRFQAIAEVAATAGLPLEQIEALGARLVFE